MNKDLGKRIRYYQSMMDADNLLKGTPYSQLKESYIIFICLTDPFLRGDPVYEFETTYKKDHSLILHDNMHKIIYNASGYSSIENKKLKALMKFITSSLPEDDFTEKLSEKVTDVQNNERFQKEYMSMNIREWDVYDDGMTAGIEKGIEKGKAEGLAEGAKNIACNMLKLGLDDAMILKTTEITKEQLEELKAQKI